MTDTAFQVVLRAESAISLVGVFDEMPKQFIRINDEFGQWWIFYRARCVRLPGLVIVQYDECDQGYQ